MSRGFMFSMGGGEDLPPEVRAWLETQAEKAMEIFGATHGTGEQAPGGFILAMVNDEAVPDEAELTDEQVELEHAHVQSLSEYITKILPMPADWSALKDSDKIRVSVYDDYLHMVASGPGTCVHRDRAQRDLMDIADRIDMWTALNELEMGDDAEIAKTVSELREPAGTRVPTCGQSWHGLSGRGHVTGVHQCTVRDNHKGRHRCSCGVTRTRALDEPR